MSKRNTAPSNLATKKSKVDELDDCWDDDLDVDAIDDCFERASQVVAEKNDVKLLSSYSIFKQSTNLFTSTQSSQAVSGDQGRYDDRIRELQRKYAEKEGEVSILRSNLQNLRTSCHINEERKQTEWKEKFSCIEKENKTVRSELEFKNLEIVNLKQQIAELSKVVNAEQNFTQGTHFQSGYGAKSFSPEKLVKAFPNIQTSRIYVNNEKCYPLKCFKFLSKQSNSALSSWNHFLRKQDLSEAELMSIYDDLKPLINLPSEEINSEKNSNHLNKALWILFQILTNFYQILKEMEEVQSSGPNPDCPYNRNMRISEISSICHEILTFFAELVPHSSYLRHWLLSEQPLQLNDSLRQLSMSMTNESRSCSYLSLLSLIVSTIVKLRIEETCSRLLSSLMIFFCKLFSVEPMRQDGVSLILGKICSLQPSFELSYQIIVLLGIITRNPNSVGFLWSKGEAEEDFCSLYSAILVVEDTLNRTQDGAALLRLGLKVLNLTYNIFKADNFCIYEHEHKRCECMSRLLKLTIRIIFESLDGSQVEFLPKNIIKLLSLLSFNTYDMTQKYVADLAHLREIIYTLVGIGGMTNLEKLTMPEEFQEISEDRFIAVNL